MALPAIILCEPSTASLRVAGLTVLDRLLVVLSRAGAGRITIVCLGAMPRLKRAPALGITPEVLAELPGSGVALESTLLVSASCLVQVGDVRRLLEQGGRLVNTRGDALPLGVVGTGAALSASALEGLAGTRAEGVAERVTDAATAREAARRLWGSLTSSADGWVDRWFNRPVGRPLSKVLAHTAVTPNQVSVSATVLGVVAAWCFSLGRPGAALWGAVLLQLSAVIDCVDGDLARVLYKESRLGKWLDIVGDQVVHVTLFVSIGVGLWRAGSSAPVLALGLSAGVGVVLAFLVVLRGLMQPQWAKDTPLQKLIDATTNRDFSVLLLCLAWAGRLEWFLWLTAIGVHVFWATALVLQLRKRESGAPCRRGAG